MCAAPSDFLPDYLVGVQPSRRTLGKGGFAYVLLGKWQGREVAIKYLHNIHMYPDEGADEDQPSKAYYRFVDEFQTLRDLNHECLVQVYGVSPPPSTRDSHGLVMECLPITLRKRYSKTPHFAIHQEVTVACDVCRGLEYLHSRGILHRDLTTSNIMLTGSAWDSMHRAKITDFGLAHRLRDLSVDMQSFSAEVGTRRYMAPESREDKGSKRPRYGIPSDVYSMAVSVFCMCIREEMDICEGEGNMLGKMGLRHPLKELVAKSIVNDPSQRPKASDLCRHLSEHQRLTTTLEVTSGQSSQSHSHAYQEAVARRGKIPVRITSFIPDGDSGSGKSSLCDALQGKDHKYNRAGDPWDSSEYRSCYPGLLKRMDIDSIRAQCFSEGLIDSVANEKLMDERYQYDARKNLLRIISTTPSHFQVFREILRSDETGNFADMLRQLDAVGPDPKGFHPVLPRTPSLSSGTMDSTLPKVPVEEESSVQKSGKQARIENGQVGDRKDESSADVVPDAAEEVSVLDANIQNAAISRTLVEQRTVKRRYSRHPRHMAENEDDDVGEKRPALLAGENPTDMGDALQAQGGDKARQLQMAEVDEITGILEKTTLAEDEGNSLTTIEGHFVSKDNHSENWKPVEESHQPPNEPNLACEELHPAGSGESSAESIEQGAPGEQRSAASDWQVNARSNGSAKSRSCKRRQQVTQPKASAPSGPEAPVGQIQEQAQEISLRSPEASAQKAYDIFGYTVGSIEILEMYHNQESWKAQDIRLSPESEKMLANWKESAKELTLERILGHVNVHLRVMQAQMTSCHKDIRERLKEEFTSEIEEWLSSCMESEGEVMAQIKVQLLRALNGEMPEQVKPPATLHQYTESTVSEDEQSPTPSIFGGLFAMIMRGFERIDAIDANFREHPEKSSKRPRLRDRYR